MHLVLCLFVHWNCYFGSTSRLLSGRGVVAAKNCEHILRIRAFSGALAWHGMALLLCSALAGARGSRMRPFAAMHTQRKPETMILLLSLLY